LHHGGGGSAGTGGGHRRAAGFRLELTPARDIRRFDTSLRSSLNDR